MYKIMKKLEHWLSRTVDRQFRAASKLGDKPFFNPEDLPATRDLEENWPAIRGEVDEVLKRYDELTPFQTMSPDQEYLSNDDRWKFFFLKCVNIKFRKNINLMPKTMAVIDRHPEIVSAYLSILAPGKSLPPHRGPWPGILRAHLGVTIPENHIIPEHHFYNCQALKPHLVVDNLVYYWEEGKVVFFDDRYLHEAHNPTHEIRVVLFMDVARPMQKPWSRLNMLILHMSWALPYVWIPYFRHRKWEKKFYG